MGPDSIKENDRVVLTADIPKEGLKTGNVGTVVRVFKGAGAYEVEFLTPEGDPVCVTTVHASQVRRVGEEKISNAGQ
ncbi:MAG TPA: DUF4926 domain-containing protein [Nitrospiria bacterium]|jgi:hypothetical protein|nr:DUF4926 domain-containing protein [Nitrospiria bacterium]